MNTQPHNCQAFACERNTVDEMNLFCKEHWAMVPESAQAIIKNLYNEDPNSEDHKKWQREVRKLVAMMMAKEENLNRNTERKNLDEFNKPDPFVIEGRAEGVAAQRGKVLGKSGNIEGSE